VRDEPGYEDVIVVADVILRGQREERLETNVKGERRKDRALRSSMSRNRVVTHAVA
jgi:hypothetical protein